MVLRVWSRSSRQIAIPDTTKFQESVKLYYIGTAEVTCPLVALFTLCLGLSCIVVRGVFREILGHLRNSFSNIICMEFLAVGYRYVDEIRRCCLEYCTGCALS
jgi:hypothetical protein